MLETSLTWCEMINKFGWVIVLLLGACGTDGENNAVKVDVGKFDTDFKLMDMGPDDFSSMDSAPDLVEDLAVVDIDPCTELSWESADAGSFVPRDHHATFITTRGKPRLHVVGGTNYSSVFSDHWVADISDTGALGTWRQGAAIPASRAGQSVILKDGNVWLVGGQSRMGFQANTYRAEWAEDEISGWVEDAPIPEGRFHSTGVATDGNIWVTGGLGDGGEAQPTIFRGSLGDTGEVLSWETLTLPAARSHHGAFVHGDDVYLAFGFSGTPVGNMTTPHLDIVKFSSSTGPTISLDQFFKGSNEYATLAATATDGCVRTFGGIVVKNNEPEYLSTVLRFDFGNAVAELDTKFSEGRSHMHQAPYYNGAFYVVGGSIAYQDVTSNIEIGRVAR